MVDNKLQEKIFNMTGNKGYSLPVADDLPVPSISIDQMAQAFGGVVDSTWTGDKYYNSFGITKNFEIVDHYLLRKRSKQLFTENLYARGLIRRLLTNEINQGLALEAIPDVDILSGVIGPDELSEWAENTERRFNIWVKNPDLCDYSGQYTFGGLQRLARMMALISGDVLVVLRQDPLLKLPTVDLIDADHVSNPVSDTLLRGVNNRGNKLIDGVELDKQKRQVAYFVEVTDPNGRKYHKRVTAYGSKTGRKQAWLLYGTEKMLNDVRGQSLLAIVLTSLKDIDRYRDAELRAAVINAMIAMWIKKGEDKVSSLPFTAGATRKDTVTTQDDLQGRKDIQHSHNLPGLVYQELQQGEEPVSYDTRRPNINYSEFETAVISAIAWAHEIPPEILLLGFSNNFSASRGAVNEFKMYLDRIRCGFGEELNDPIYKEWLLSEVLRGKIDAPEFLNAWQDRNKWDIFGAWNLASWSGAIKPSVDLLKEVKAYLELINAGLITRDRAARELTGGKYSKIVQQLLKENNQIVEANKSLVENGLLGKLIESTTGTSDGNVSD